MQQIKLPLKLKPITGILVSVLVWAPDTLLLIQFPASASQEAADISSGAWAAVSHVGELGAVLALGFGLAQLLWSFGGVNLYMEDFLFFFHATFPING